MTSPRSDPELAYKSALAWGRAGWHVFPLIPMGKTPAVRNGFKSATTDPERIRGWWDRNPGCNIGVDCGRSGLVVVDIDPDNGGLDTLWQLIRTGWDFPPTLSQITPSHGCHYFYRAPEGVETRNSASKIGGVSAPGIDVRGAGGYVVIAPSVTEKGTYEWLPDGWATEPVAAPSWLVRGDHPRRLFTAVVSESTGYGEAALEGECEAIRTAPNGTRNTQLNESAFKIYTLVAAGGLDETTATRELAATALAAGLSDIEVRNTLKSARTAGFKSPRRVS